MNRRTFLQSIGALAVIPAIPVIAKRCGPTPKGCEPKPMRCWENIPTWIDFVDQMPQVGQKVALCTYFHNHTSINIATGIVYREVTDPIRYGRYYYKNGTVLIELGLSYSPDGFFRNSKGIHGKPADVDCDICLYDLALYDCLALEVESRGAVQKKIHKTTWIDNDKEVVYPISGLNLLAPRHGYKISLYFGRDRTYWFPIDDYIPQHLPTLPEPLPLILDDCGNVLK